MNKLQETIRNIKEGLKKKKQMVLLKLEKNLKTQLIDYSWSQQTMVHGPADCFGK